MTHYPLIAPRPPKLSEHLDALRRVERSGIYSNNGPEVRGFAADVTARLFGGAGASLAVANATLGLMVAIRDAATPRLARKSVVPGKSVSGRVDLGERPNLNKKTK